MKKMIFAVIFLAGNFLSKAQLQIGSTVPEISLPDVKDSIINLSSFNGKVVLIDFWASWCAPCRATNPSVVRLYNRYKDKDFEVFGVSIDSKKAAWLKAIKQDKIKFTQVNDNTGWYSKTAEQYFVDQIPTNFLLDKTGKIVAIDLGGKKLEDQIKALLQ